MNALRPFFPYFGSKWRLAPRYPAPKHSLVIEPFAGSAGYAVRQGAEHALLIDLDENIVAVWSYLIRATASEILALPDFEAGEEIRGVIPEAAALIGFWANRGSSSPKPTMQKWQQHEMRIDSWGRLARERIATQLERIRRWSVRLGNFDLEPDHRATWFIDPPYVEQGFRYRKHAIDFAGLGAWCKRRRGQVIVCEGPGARWLPFEPLCLAKTKHGFSPEFVFLQNDPPPRGQRFCSECKYEITRLARASNGALRASKTCGEKCARARKTRLEAERRMLARDGEPLGERISRATLEVQPGEAALAARIFRAGLPARQACEIDGWGKGDCPTAQYAAWLEIRGFSDTCDAHGRWDELKDAATSRDLPHCETCGKSHRGELAEDSRSGSLDTEALTSGTAVDQEKALTSITPPEFEGAS